MKRPYDVVVIGGSVTGSIAGLCAARSGLDVRIVGGIRGPSDDGTPQLPEPAESVGAEIESLAAALGLSSVIEAATIARFHRMESRGRVRRSGPSFRQYKGRHVLRSRLDGMLRDHAADAGCWVDQGQKIVRILSRDDRGVVVQTDEGERIAAQFLIDASGRRQWLRHSLDLGRHILSPPLLASRGVANGLDFRFSRAPQIHFDRHGWLWRANESMTRSTWTLLSPARLQCGAKATKASSRCSLDCRTPATPISVTWCMATPLAAQDYALAGDAAAVLDPAAGYGLAMAAYSGAAAAQFAVRRFADRARIAQYAVQYHENISERVFRLAHNLRDGYRGEGCLLFEV